VVITGDTAPCDTVTELARGADTLVVQCLDVEGRLPALTAGSMAGSLGAARMAAAAGVGRMVLVHQRPSASGGDGPAAMVSDAATVFDGPIHFANEADVLDLG
jgi:ribonuclease BN (tRNA processing enzyme)